MNLRPKRRRSIPKLLSAAIIAASVLVVSACGGLPDRQVIAASQADDLVPTVTTERRDPPTAERTQPPQADDLVPTDTTQPSAPRVDPSELSARELVIAAMSAQDSESSRVRTTTDSDGADGFAQEQHSEIDAHGNTRTITRIGAGLEDPEAQTSVEMLMVDGVVYGRFSVPEELHDESGIEFPDGWMTMGRETMELLGLNCGPPLPASAPGSDECVPPNDLSEMADFVLEAAIVGRETVRGVETIRVESALDFKSLMEAALSEAADGGLMGLMLALMPSEVPIELWVDDDLRAHRIRMDLTLNLAALGEEFGSETDETPTVVTVMDFYDFGADITIEVPPLDEIVGEFGEWLEDLGFPGLIDDPGAEPVSTA